MKKLFALLMALVLALGACALAEAEEGMLVGGWLLTDAEATISEDEAAVFEKALEGLTGAGYAPVKLLGTQLVAGTNYCFLCQQTLIVPDAAPGWCLVYIYESLDGGAEITHIADLDIAALSE